MTTTPETPPARRSPRLNDDEIWEFVTDAHTGVMTTLRRDGMPIALPLWYMVVDRAIYTSSRGKKLVRLANNSKASFLVETGDMWVDLKAAHFTGTASIIEPDATLLAKLNAENNRKYARFRPPSNDLPDSAKQVYANTMQWIRFVPDPRVLSWENARLVGR